MAQSNYNEGVRSVAPEEDVPNDYLSARAATPEAFGAAKAQGMEALGQGALTAGKFFGKVAADDASNQFQDFSTKLLHGDPSKTTPGPDGQSVPDTGYLGTRGRATLDQRPVVEKAMDEKIKEIKSGLTTPEQQQEFENFTRRYRSTLSERIGSHADGQATTWYAHVNTASAKLAMDHISNNYDNPNEVNAGFHDLIGAYVKNAELQGATPDTPQYQEALASARRDGLEAQLNAMAVKDPSRALAVLDKNKDIAGVKYDDMASKFRNRAQQQQGYDIGEQALKKTYTAQPSSAATLATLTQAGAPYGVSGAYLQRTQQLETGDNPNQTSSTGAKGPFQFVGSTAQQYGVKDPFNYAQAADGAARLAADNKAALTGSLGRAPTDPELYLGHNQGAKGAALLISHPNVRAGDLVGDAAIRVNGGDPNAPASAFTAMITNKWNAAPSTSFTQRKAAAYQDIMADTTLDPQTRAHALTYVSQQIQAGQIAEEQDSRAAKARNDTAQQQFVAEIIKGTDASIIQKIANSGLPANEMENLYKFAVGDGGVENTMSYGPGYTDTFRRVLANENDPSRIVDPGAVIAMGPGGTGQLTKKGVGEILSSMDKIKKQPDQAGIATVKSHQLEHYKDQFAIDQNFNIPGMKPFKNQKGLDKFNHDFVPAFEAAYSQWIAAGKNPMDFLSDNKKMDEIMNRVYPLAERAKDTVRGDDTSDAKPLPPPPEGVDAKGWNYLMSDVPKGAKTNGEPLDAETWGKVVNWLRNDPSPENRAKFDKRMGPAGYTADYVLKHVPSAAPTNPAVEKLKTDNAADAGNLKAADTALHLTPEEKSLYQRHLSNLHGPGGVDNPDGSRSTLFQTTVEHDGKFYVIPTVFDGKILWDKGAADPAAKAVDKVKQIGWDKFPSYKSEEEAEARYDAMHKFMEKDTADYKRKQAENRVVFDPHDQIEQTGPVHAVGVRG